MPSTFFQVVYLSLVASLLAVQHVCAGLPSKIYGVNLGSWLLLEAWMLPAEWLAMGGQQCDDCSTCIATEFAFAKAFPDTVDEKFNEHWNTWFNQTDVDALKSVGINTVRIPLGFWIVEAIVNRTTEFYPRGGIHQLRRGLQQLRDAGITAILDHHALPGVQTAGQMFAGQCTNDVEFYTDPNYHRALIWTAVMTALSHLDPAFSSVAAIEAVNEPIMDASQTPGYGDFQKNFVQVVRAVELSMGIVAPGLFPHVSHRSYSSRVSRANISPAAQFTSLSGSLATAMEAVAGLTSIFNPQVISVLQSALPIINQIAEEFSLDGDKDLSSLKSAHVNREALTTNFMDINWQFNNPANPADAKLGPQGYDNHLYYSFGGVADANEEAYLTSICNLNRIQADAKLGNSPLWFGEWGLPTQFTATDDFLFKWADAQKLQYSKDAGWIFWNFKVEISDLAGDLARQWSYLNGVKLGFLNKDPAKLNDPHVCDAYVNATAPSSA